MRFNLKPDSGHVPSITLSNADSSLAGRWTTPPFANGAWENVDTIPIAAKYLNAWLACAGSCPPSGTAHTYIKNLYFTISDATGPTIDGLGGSLLAGGVRRGTEEISLTASDNASLTGATVRANGVLIAERSVPCDLVVDGPARSFRPCLTSTGWVIPVNTELLPEGHNSIETCVYDLAFDPGARNRTCETRTIHVDNSCPSSGGARATAIDAGLKAGTSPARASIRLRSHKPADVLGRLSGPGPVGGATVCLYEQVDLPGDGRELVDTGRVRSDGTFSLDVEPGPSRNFDVVYRYNNETVERVHLYLNSVVAPAFRVVGRTSLRNGQNVRFRGALPGPNAEGRGISLQARAGRKWRTFKQLKADSKGRFHAIYRFTQTTGRARYVFRARVKRQGNYPYSPGHSRKRLVVVRG